jgi:hypothetical protein
VRKYPPLPTLGISTFLLCFLAFLMFPTLH